MRVTFDSLSVRKPITTTSTPYTSGDQVGSAVEIGPMCTDAGGTGTLLSLTMVDKAKQASDTDIFFFNQSPTVTSSDNTAFDMTDANAILQYIGHVSFSSADYKTSTSSSFIASKAIGLGLSAAGVAKSVYALVVTRGTPTYAAGADLELICHINRD